MRSPVIRGEEKRRGGENWRPIHGRGHSPQRIKRASEGGREGEERIFPPNSEPPDSLNIFLLLLHEPTIFDFRRGSGPLAEPHSFRGRGSRFYFGLEFDI